MVSMDVVMVTKGCTSCPHSGKVLVKNSVIKVLVLASLIRRPLSSAETE